jgi:hypothetical protein
MQKWCDEFKALDQVPMTKEQSELFLYVCMGLIDKEKIANEFGYKVATSRAEAIGLKYNEDFIQWLGLNSKTPGEIVMYLSLMRHEQNADPSPTNMEKFAKIFSFGFPSNEDLGKLWDKQKGAGAINIGNHLDGIEWS